MTLREIGFDFAEMVQGKMMLERTVRMQACLTTLNDLLEAMASRAEP